MFREFDGECFMGFCLKCESLITFDTFISTFRDQAETDLETVTVLPLDSATKSGYEICSPTCDFSSLLLILIMVDCLSEDRVTG